MKQLFLDVIYIEKTITSFEESEQVEFMHCFTEYQFAHQENRRIELSYIGKNRKGKPCETFIDEIRNFSFFEWLLFLWIFLAAFYFRMVNSINNGIKYSRFKG